MDWGNFFEKKTQALGEELLDFKKAYRGNIYDSLEVYLPLTTFNTASMYLSVPVEAGRAQAVIYKGGHISKKS